MRPIGSLPTETDAVRLGDYLLSIGMRNHIEPARDGSWLVWIEHDDNVEQGQLQLRQFAANPNDPRYDDASAKARAVRKQQERDAQRRQKNFTDVRTRWSGMNAGSTPVSTAILGICLVVGLATKLGSMDEGLAHTIGQALSFQSMEAVLALAEQHRALFGHGHLSTMFSSIAHGEVWRLITPAFLHFGVLHLIFNMTWVIATGRLIELRKGSAFLLVFVLIAAVLTNCGEALWAVYNPWDHLRLGYESFGGFSGVNYALFGYAWMKGRYQPYESIGVSQQTTGLMLTWLVLCMSQVMGPVANAAHVVGLVVGVLVGAWPTLKRKVTAR